MPISLPLSTVCFTRSNHCSDKYGVTSPGRGWMNTPPMPLSLKSSICSSICCLVTSSFHTHNGAERYPAGGSAKSSCSSFRELSSTLFLSPDRVQEKRKTTEKSNAKRGDFIFLFLISIPYEIRHSG